MRLWPFTVPPQCSLSPSLDLGILQHLVIQQHMALLLILGSPWGDRADKAALPSWHLQPSWEIDVMMSRR